jgi:hypothetical protein
MKVPDDGIPVKRKKSELGQEIQDLGKGIVSYWMVFVDMGVIDHV